MAPDDPLRQGLLSAEEPGPDAEPEEDLYKASTPQDVTSVRAKNERKGKVTADKWNQ
jgi:hypothetical protein